MPDQKNKSAVLTQPQSTQTNSVSTDPPEPPARPEKEEENWSMQEWAAAMELINPATWSSQRMEMVATGYMRINRSLNEAMENLDSATSTDSFKDIIKANIQQAATQARAS